MTGGQGSEQGLKSSTKVALGSIATLAVLVTAYASLDNEEETARCVSATPENIDGHYRVVDESLCDDDDDYRSTSHGGYFWYYGGRYSAGRVHGGSTTAPSGSTTVRTSSGRTISRGGFGGSGYRGGG